jgi:hypothetical protein
VIALLAAAAVAGHAYVLPWAVLFELPAPSERACAISSLRFGPPDGKWERGTQRDKPVSCEFRQFALPGPLVPTWAEAAELDEVRVTYTVQGSEEPQTVSLTAERIDPASLAVGTGALTATVQKVKDNVRSVVTSNASHPVLLGDVLAARNKPKDDCRGPGPSAVLQKGESLLDVRPGLLSPSMQVWVAAFTGQKQCTWVKAATRHR